MPYGIFPEAVKNDKPLKTRKAEYFFIDFKINLPLDAEGS